MDLARATDGRGLVRGLTKASADTFVCFQVFHETYSARKQSSSEVVKKAYKAIKEQSRAYACTINASVNIAECGIKICRNAKLLLSDHYKVPPECMALLVANASDAHKNASVIANDFRNIRQAVFQSAIPLGNTYESIREKEVDLCTLRSMAGESLVALTAAVLAKLADTAGMFVDWWTSLKVDVERAIALRSCQEVSSSVWDSLEAQYTAYDREVRRQDDYYKHLNTKPAKQSRFKKFLPFT